MRLRWRLFSVSISPDPAHFWLNIPYLGPAAGSLPESNMGKEQRNEKMSKKPKKDSSIPKGPVNSDRPTPPMTSVIPRGKEKNK
jgi:hypothetical protein